MESLVREPEVWKDIPGYEGLYQVSSWGNVKSFDILINHYSGIKRIRKGKLLTKNIYKKDMYYVVVLCKNREKKRFPIHLLVLKVFVCDKPSEKHKGNHKDLDKLNNYYKNLEWVTIRENTSHYYLSTNKSSEFIGVTYDSSMTRKKRWIARICINKKNINLGRFITPEEASVAYRKALEEYGIQNKYSTINQGKP
jgi:hypothetical protein